jgi:hypothetical protein
MKYLAKIKIDYADEFDVQSFHIFTQDEWISYPFKIARIEEENREECDELGEFGIFSTHFGTNEFVEYDTLDNYIRAIAITQITDEEADFLEKHLVEYEHRYGMNIWLD